MKRAIEAVRVTIEFDDVILRKIQHKNEVESVFWNWTSGRLEFASMRA
jgi:hypothetical protein